MTSNRGKKHFSTFLFLYQSFEFRRFRRTSAAKCKLVSTNRDEAGKSFAHDIRKTIEFRSEKVLTNKNTRSSWWKWSLLFFPHIFDVNGEKLQRRLCNLRRTSIVLLTPCVISHYSKPFEIKRGFCLWLRAYSTPERWAGCERRETDTEKQN